MKYGLCNCRNELVYYVVFPANFLSPCTVPDILIVILLLAKKYLIYFRKERNILLWQVTLLLEFFLVIPNKSIPQDNYSLVNLYVSIFFTSLHLLCLDVSILDISNIIMFYTNKFNNTNKRAARLMVLSSLWTYCAPLVPRGAYVFLMDLYRFSRKFIRFSHAQNYAL